MRKRNIKASYGVIFMGIKQFKRLHKYGQELLYDRFHTQLKVVLEDDKKNQFIAYCIISKYQDNNIAVSSDLFDVNKVYIKFRIDELKECKDVKTKSIKLVYGNIKTVILDGLRYNVNKFEVNNQTRDFLIMELTKFKN